MKRILTLYGHDLRSIYKSWTTLIIIIGLACLPSLYAWFNIKATWDPYGNTQGIPLAVVNNDTGAVLEGKPLRLGDDIVEELRHNDKIGWVFTSESKAREGVRRGDYYASLVIPTDFSKKIATVLDDEPDKAVIIYTVNEKINAVAPKITSSGASAVIEEVRQQFVKTANGTIFRILNEVGVELENELPTINKVRELVFKLEGIFPELNQAAALAERDISRADGLVRKVQDNLPLAAQLAKEGEELTGKLVRYLGVSSEVLEGVPAAVKQNLQLLEQSILATQQFIPLLRESAGQAGAEAGAGVGGGSAAIEASLTAAQNSVERGTAAIDGISSLLRQLGGESTAAGGALSPALNQLQELKSELLRQGQLLTSIRDAVDKQEQVDAERLKELSRLSDETAERIRGLVSGYDSGIEPAITGALNGAKSRAEEAQKLLQEASSSLPEMEQILKDAARGLRVGGAELAAIRGRLPDAQERVASAADRIRELEKQGNIQEVIDLLRNNFEKESAFFAEPVRLQEQKLFPIPNYGSAMSPFFTTMSLWAGALMLVSLLAVNLGSEEGGYRSYQVYFGRFLTFLTIALVQSVLVTAGDIYILKAYVVHPWAFIGFGLLISAVFMLIVYTLVSLLGNAGKALSIVLLVLQLAGSGGTFPIEVTPSFFQAIYHWLPFTYAISLLREAVGGIVDDRVVRDLWSMLGYAAVTIVLGITLKPYLNRLSSRLLRKEKTSRLLH
ncbi:YhgE/Pip family protein [Paenibacillus sp. GCM10023252]|uniref:YhgE/Pip family protein n=1 Tax=Paenibacillus sp. GCM10023252 TaxID=3252649 RepID=UPI0036196A59